MGKKGSFKVDIGADGGKNNGMYDGHVKFNGDDHSLGGSTGPVKDGDTSSNDETVKHSTTNVISFWKIFRYADALDITCMAAATLAAMIHGAGLPMLMVIFGDIMDLFIGSGSGNNALADIPWGSYNTTKDEAVEDDSMLKYILGKENKSELYDQIDTEILTDLTPTMQKYALYAIYTACIVTVSSYFQVALWFRASHRQGQKIRATLFKSILQKDIGWFDTHASTELNTRLADDIDVVIDGMGDKISIFIQWMTTCVVGILVAFTFGWKLACVVTAVAPILGIVGALTAKRTAATTVKEMQAYATAGAVAEESIASFRTVLSFSGEEKQSEKYNNKLTSARSYGIWKGVIQGSGLGTIQGLMCCVYAVCFWYGAKLIREEDYSAGKMVTVFYNVIIAATALSYALPNISAMSQARGAAHALWKIIDETPSIDWTKDEGETPAECNGRIEFTDVSFSYPSRKDTMVLKGVNLDVYKGQTVALVGSSGCGKSTTVQLLQRFYDPDDGEILIDGTDIRMLNVQWLRQHIGVVSQEPVLFATSIAENIRFGRENVTQQEIDDACKEANAYDFIQNLPNKYETLVGERGAQLSGGQKQRIAIARALVRDPKILLLDEATSALDTESEATVQAALDKARQGRTTIIIAHRLSTIKTADMIFGFKDGKIIEHGTHDELMKISEGVYCQLVQNQQCTTGDDNDFDNDMTDSDEEVEITDKKLAREVSVLEDLQHEEEELDKKQKAAISPMRWALGQNSPETCHMIIGALGALFAGLQQPAFALVVTQLYGVFEKPVEDQSRLVNIYCLAFLALGVISATAIFLMHYMFAYSGSYLTWRLRSKSFHHLLRKDVSYYDDPAHGTGSVVASLASNTTAIQGASGPQIGMICQAIGGLGTGIIIGFVYSWQITLCVLGFAPFLLIGGILSQRIITGSNASNKSAMELAAKLGFEAIDNIRTVTSLSKQQWFIDNYIKYTIGPYKKATRNSHVYGGSYAITQAFLYLAFAGVFSLGAFLIEEDKLTFVRLQRVFFAIVMGSLAAGNATRYLPSYSKGKEAAFELHKLFTTTSDINGNTTKGTSPTSVVGSLQFSGVQFSYPTRPTVPVLRHLDLTVNEGEMVALVGSSGCGKSTTIQLIERFYDVNDGDILLDGTATSSLNIRWLRSQFGLVSQEPILFDASIADNIAYGDNSREVDMSEIIEAARKANIHNFIQSLPEAYATNVGSKGAKLSGGQKQRIAIARALIRDPKVLLLDEATSALDTESEKIVQEALDAAQQGRTSIVIAHRLSTIVNANKILVFHHGKIVEAGTHQELLAQKGFYYKLNQAQLRKKS